MRELTEAEARLFLERNFGWLTHGGAREHVDTLHRKYRGGDPIRCRRGSSA